MIVLIPIKSPKTVSGDYLGTEILKPGFCSPSRIMETLKIFFNFWFYSMRCLFNKHLFTIQYTLGPYSFCPLLIHIGAILS
jgi:hypothetical protein